MGAVRIIPSSARAPHEAAPRVPGEVALRFPRELYRLRALVETVVSSIRRQVGDLVAGETPRMQRKQALLLGLGYTLYRLKRPLVRPTCHWLP